MSGPLTALGMVVPVLAAPMAGGPTTPELVLAAGRTGGFGFLAAGYRNAEALAGQIGAVRREQELFGVNLFAPNPVPVDEAEFRRYAGAIAEEAARYGLDARAAPIVEDDDHWSDKIDLLRSDPVPMVSFTFGIPERAVIAALRAVGTLTAATVTSADEACRAAAAGVEILVVQAAAAGGHSGTLTPSRPIQELPIAELIAAVRAVADLPIIAAGGLATPEAVAAVRHAGAEAIAVGTVLLRSDEAGTSAPYRDALADPDRTGTLLTRAFSGRPARALRNEFTDRYDAMAPSGYPAVHHLTTPMRRAAAAAGEPERINLWAGTGFRHATAEPAADILVRLASRL